ncbi:hypothetical protein [Pseudomonas sp. W5-01]|uniref:hypothetical protein n=1 Tax=Pseudomonas sp. W5-01 TaxID=3097454 RepID=UPI00397E2710
MKYSAALGFTVFLSIFACSASADSGGFQCMHMAASCLMTGVGCCGDSQGGGLVPFKPSGPDPDPGVVVYPAGYPPRYAGVSVTVPATTWPTLFNSVTYNGVITGPVIFRTGINVAWSADGPYGALTNGAPGTPVTIHVSVPVKWANPRLTVCARRAHVTSTYGNQVCRVFANGACSCPGNNNWDICGYSNPIKPVMVAAASTAAASLVTSVRGFVTLVADNVADCGPAP